MTKLAVVADDLTGANDTAVQFTKKHMRSYVKLDINMTDNDSEVLVIDSDSRDLEPQEAYDRVKAICLKIAEGNIPCIYKKIDSTMRGNVGIEIKAAADVFDPELIIIAPAYPENKRVTIGGYHLLDGMPLEYTEMAHAPKTPINSSYIPEILRQQVDAEIGLLELMDMNKGINFIRQQIDEFVDKGVKWVVCDAVKQSDFTLITEAVKTYNKILWVGSAGLAEHLGDFYDWRGTSDYGITARSGPVLVVAGSVSHTTQEQIEYATVKGGIKIVQLDMDKILSNPQEEKKTAAEKLRKIILEDNDALITAAADDRDVSRALWTGQQYGFTGKEVSERTACFLAELVAELDLNPLAGMILTGGDTAVHVCRAIEADGIEVIKEIDSGVPLGRLCGRRFAGMFVVTKAGAFGGPQIFKQAIDIMRNKNTADCESGRMAE